jgi:hypothetical protein
VITSRVYQVTEYHQVNNSPDRGAFRSFPTEGDENRENREEAKEREEGKRR